MLISTTGSKHIFYCTTDSLFSSASNTLTLNTAAHISSVFTCSDN